MYGVEHLKYWGVTEDFADSKWCYAFNNFLWIHALKCKNFRGVLWRVRGLKFDLPSEQSLLNASDLCSFHSSCSQGVMFWMWQACSAANPLAAGTESWATFRMPGRSSNLSLMPAPLVTWADRLSTHLYWLFPPWFPVSGILMGSPRAGFPIILLLLLKLTWFWEL